MMQDSVALQRYLQRHVEANLPQPPQFTEPWRHVVVIPAYAETPAALQHLAMLPVGAGRALILLILNRPDSDPDQDANNPLRNAVAELPQAAGSSHCLHRLNSHTDLYLHDLEALQGATPASQGVGLARKVGCDIALQWMIAGAIQDDWLYSSDADARLPQDYFLKLAGADDHTTAAVLPFRHVPGQDTRCNAATAIYELRLHQYVLGLACAGSPYAYHSIGSCLAIRAQAYVQVRGFPRRAGAEDFYLLNKVAKLGAIAHPGGPCLELESRFSPRVPFGTGPAVQRIAEQAHPDQYPLFYHPQCFAALQGVLTAIPGLWQSPQENLHTLLCATGLEGNLASASHEALLAMGIEKALQHCHQQGRSREQFQRQFHQWFDAFRTLKFIHTLRDKGWPQLSLNDLAGTRPMLWPGDDYRNVEVLRDAIATHWGWQ